MPDSLTDTPETTPASLRVSAMNFLARREHSAEELRQKLKRHSDDDSLIGPVCVLKTYKAMSAMWRRLSLCARVRAKGLCVYSRS